MDAVLRRHMVEATDKLETAIAHLTEVGVMLVKRQSIGDKQIYEYIQKRILEIDRIVKKLETKKRYL